MVMEEGGRVRGARVAMRNRFAPSTRVDACMCIQIDVSTGKGRWGSRVVTADESRV